MGKLPYFNFYPEDWRSDAVFGCSLAARGLWHEMMNLMHFCEPYGYLATNGKPMPDEQVSRRCGTSTQEYAALLGELDAAGIPRRNSEGIIYSKRMVSDDKKRKEWRKWQKTHRLNKKSCQPDVRVMSTVSSSSFPSPIKEREREEKTNTAAAPQIVSVAGWLAFVEMRKKMRKPLTERAGELIRQKLLNLKEQGFDPEEVLEQSVMRSWAGVFPIEEDRRNGTNGTVQPKSFDQVRNERTDAALARILEHNRSLSAEAGKALSPGIGRDRVIDLPGKAS
jgi:hypothetical protein